MDYGSTLPKIVSHNLNIRSKHYIKQSVFRGSDREIRGKIIDILLHTKNHTISQQGLFKKLNSVIASDSEAISTSHKKNQSVTPNDSKAISGVLNKDLHAPLAMATNRRYKKIITDLEKEGFIEKRKKSIILR
jgi:hypothetical protein